MIRYAEHHKKDPSEVAWLVVETDGGTAKGSGTTLAPKPKMMFPVLKKREKTSKEQRRVNEFAIMKQRGGDSGRMSYKEAVGLMHDQDGMMMHDGAMAVKYLKLT